MPPLAITCRISGAWVALCTTLINSINLGENIMLINFSGLRLAVFKLACLVRSINFDLLSVLMDISVVKKPTILKPFNGQRKSDN